MITASREYHQFAVDCLRWASETKDPGQRDVLRKTAAQWMALAHEIDEAALLIEDQASFRASLKRLMD